MDPMLKIILFTILTTCFAIFVVLPISELNRLRTKIANLPEGLWDLIKNHYNDWECVVKKAYDRVIDISKKMLKVDPTAKYNHALFSTYAKALYNTGQKKQALQQIEKAIKLNPLDKDYRAIKEKMLKDEILD